ncbi:MAG: peptidoglycan editing factor PgeF [Bacteroidota bacterium]
MEDNGLIRFNIFESYSNLLVFTTTKQTFGFVNPRFTGTSELNIQNYRELLAKALGLKTIQFVFPQQTHTNCVAEIKGIQNSEISETDALVTNKSEICLCVQTADCVPILLFDPVKRVISAIHAGWRGTVSKIVEGAVNKMISTYGCKAENILTAIGPSISPEIYEVGNEVINAVKESVPEFEQTIQKNNRGKFYFNLWEANRQILMAAGVRSKNIEIHGECSYKNSNKYFSARRDGIETGRMVSGIMIKS